MSKLVNKLGVKTPVMDAVNRILPVGVPVGYESVLAAPVVSQSVNTITLSGATHGAKIYYTTDGTTTPTAESTEYTTPFVIASNTTVKAICIDAGHKSSAVTTKVCTWVEPTPPTPTE